jgi:hypothetical protein
VAAKDEDVEGRRGCRYVTARSATTCFSSEMVYNVALFKILYPLLGHFYPRRPCDEQMNSPCSPCSTGFRLYLHSKRTQGLAPSDRVATCAVSCALELCALSIFLRQHCRHSQHIRLLNETQNPAPAIVSDASFSWMYPGTSESNTECTWYLGD